MNVAHRERPGPTRATAALVAILLVGASTTPGDLTVCANGVAPRCVPSADALTTSGTRACSTISADDRVPRPLRRVGEVVTVRPESA